MNPWLWIPIVIAWLTLGGIGTRLLCRLTDEDDPDKFSVGIMSMFGPVVLLMVAHGADAIARLTVHV